MRLSAIFIAIVLSAGVWTTAGAGTNGPATDFKVDPVIDAAVDACVINAGVQNTYYANPVRYGGVAAYSVPPGGGVNAAQSARINACIQKSVKSQPQLQIRVRARAAPVPLATDTAGCLKQYQQKLRSTRNGRDYRGERIGLRVVSRLFGNGLGRKLLDNEYDRCLDRVAYYEDRCPNGAFSGGAGYCIKRPRW